MTTTRMKGLIAPLRGLGRGVPYTVPRAADPIDLRLDANEGPAPPPEVLERARAFEKLNRYTEASGLEGWLAQRFGVEEERVLVTAGADDALLRAHLAFLDEGRDLVLPVPAFEMIPRYARLAGAAIRTVPDEGGRYPTDAVLAAIAASGPRLGMVAVVTPSNPTGSVATSEDLQRVASAAGPALVLVDLAYTEYADDDLTDAALELPNAIVVRTMSKAQGLAGARVGWAMGAAETIAPLRAAGAPYAVSGPSLALARARLELDTDVREHVERVRAERVRLAETLRALACESRPSQANFVLAEVADPIQLRDALAKRGIAVRAFPGKEGLERAVRITCPGDDRGLQRLERGLRAALDPSSSSCEER